MLSHEPPILPITHPSHWWTMNLSMRPGPDPAPRFLPRSSWRPGQGFHANRGQSLSLGAVVPQRLKNPSNIAMFILSYSVMLRHAGPVFEMSMYDHRQSTRARRRARSCEQCELCRSALLPR